MNNENQPIQPKEREVFLPTNFISFGQEYNSEGYSLWVKTKFDKVQDNNGIVYVSQN